MSGVRNKFTFAVLGVILALTASQRPSEARADADVSSELDGATAWLGDGPSSLNFSRQRELDGPHQGTEAARFEVFPRVRPDAAPSPGDSGVFASDQSAFLYERLITHALTGQPRTSVPTPVVIATGSRNPTTQSVQYSPVSGSDQSSVGFALANTSHAGSSRSQRFPSALGTLHSWPLRNSGEDMLIYVPLPPASGAGLIALGMVGLGQVRRRRLHSA